MMRLNQAWGLEDKQQPTDIFKANIPIKDDLLLKPLPLSLLEGKSRELDSLI